MQAAAEQRLFAQQLLINTPYVVPRVIDTRSPEVKKAHRLLYQALLLDSQVGCDKLVIEKLEYIVATYPKTKAASVAAKRLKHMGVKSVVKQSPSNRLKEDAPHQPKTTPVSPLEQDVIRK